MACRICKHAWDAKLVNLLYNKSGCPRCGPLKAGRLASAKAHEKYLVKVQAKFGGSISMTGLWKGATVATEHRCSEGHTFLKSPNHVIVSKNGSCSQCAYSINGKRSRRLETSSTVKKLLKDKHGSKYTLVDYSGEYLRPSTIRCNECGTHLEVPAKRLVDAPEGHGCSTCAPKFLSSHWFGTKPYRLGRRTIQVQGYEPFALDLIRLKVPCKYIVAGKDSGVPTIPYSFEGRQRVYLPDIFLPKTNTIVEVKGLRTFGMWDRDLVRKNRAKARACVALGYRFKLAIMYERKRVPVPDNWYTMTPSQITSLIRRQQRNK